MTIGLLIITACAVALTAGTAVLAWRRSATVDIAPALVTFGALVVATAVLMLPDPALRPSGDGGTRNAPPDGARPAATTGATLELVRLSDAVSGEHLTVSGRVRNPADAPARTGLSAIVMAIDDRGGVLATGQAAVDPIEPGGSSRFTVALPAGATAARYRLSFRQGATVVPHVDRRPQQPQQPADQVAAAIAALPQAGRS